MLLSESSAYPVLTRLAQSAYDQLADGGAPDHRLLSDLIGEASGKGVLRALHRKYSQTAFDAIIMPICAEIDRQAPVPPRRRPEPGYVDPLTAPAWLA
jgi:hypothetical protein